MSSNISKTTPQLIILHESAEMMDVKGFKDLPNGHIEFDGIMQTVNAINRNTNYYATDVLMPALNHPRIVEMINRNCWFGEGSHPYNRKDVARSIDIHPHYITHRICQVPYLKGDKVCSKIRTVEPCGKTVVSWVKDEKSQLGFSMRGITPYSFKKDTPFLHTVIKAPMSVLTYDIVFFPSHPEALMTMSDGSVNAIGTESAISFNELRDYIAEESSNYKLFRDELGIDIMKNGRLTNEGNGFVGMSFEDGRFGALKLEHNILSEIASYLE